MEDLEQVNLQFQLFHLCRRGQWVSRGAPGKSGLHASGEGERVMAPEPW